MQARAILLPALVAVLMGAAHGVDPAGRWRGTLDSPVGPLPVQYILTSSRATVAGTLELELGTFPLTDGVTRGDSIFFNADIQVVKLAHRGLVRGDTLFLAVHDGAEEMPIAALLRAPAQ